MKRTLLGREIACFALLMLVAGVSQAGEFASAWRGVRVWVGPEYWANPLQDWQVRGDEVVAAAAENRTLHLLTGQVENTRGALACRAAVKLETGAEPNAWAGFAFGVQGPLPEYRNALIFGSKKIQCGVRADGRVFMDDAVSEEALPAGGETQLELSIDADGSQARVLIQGTRNGKTAIAQKQVPADAIRGNLALATGGRAGGDMQAVGKKGGKGGKQGKAKKAKAVQPLPPEATSQKRKAGKTMPLPAEDGPTCSFRDWRISGGLLTMHPEQAFGPVLWTQYTLSRGVLKLTAQFPPIGKDDAQSARLEIRRGGAWEKAAEAAIHPLARTATFKVEHWDATKDTPYRVVYTWQGADRDWAGTVRRDPVDKPGLDVAFFTGEYGYIFPQSKLTAQVARENPDFLFFSGDQIYEQVGGFGVMRTGPLELCMLDYLRKYYEFGWQWRELLKDRPSVITPDDHDVFQGNIWGDNGKKLLQPKFEEGGYFMPPEWVNAVQATQTSHLPDPPDPAPIEQGIGVYFTDIVYGRVSFAVIEDRKFKSPPKIVADRGIVSRTAALKDLDVPGAQYLGERQEHFLRRWAADWAGADMKCVLSQTVYCKVTTHAGGNCTPDAPPKAPTDRDLDCGGWPQSGRNRALDLMRRGYAFLIAGDQHNSAVVHLGIEDWEDAGVAAMTGSAAVGFPRAWWPDKPGENRQPGKAEWTGRYFDGLGNRMTVLAAGNMDRGPGDLWAKLAGKPEELGQAKGSGHGLAHFDRGARTITVEQRRLLDGLFPDYPVMVKQEECYGRRATAWLPELAIAGGADPVVQVIDEASGEVVYTLRISGTKWRPKVFKAGKYTVAVGEGAGRQEYKGIEATAEPKGEMRVRME